MNFCKEREKRRDILPAIITNYNSKKTKHEILNIIKN